MDNAVTFDSGAHRSAVMPFYAAIPYESLRRLALRATGAVEGEVMYDARTHFNYAGGSRSYGYGNWRRGLPMEDTLNHAIEHLLHWKTAVENGALSADDDLAAVAWAVMLPLMTFERRYREQHERRNALLVEDLSPTQIDDRMRAEFQPCLLQPLSPELK